MSRIRAGLTHLCAEETALAHTPFSLGNHTRKLERFTVLACRSEFVDFGNGTRGDVGHAGDGAVASNGNVTEEVVGSTAKDGIGA